MEHCKQKLITMPDCILLSSPKGDFYERILKEFANGFKDAGLNSYFCCYDNENTEEKNKFYKIVNKVNPNLILEIDSILDNKKLLNSEIKHASWIQDYRFNGRTIIDNFGESDFIYFIINPIVWNINTAHITNWSVLYPGAITNNNFLQNGPTEKIDLSFIGFIPDPINMDYLLVCPVTNNSVTLKIFLSDFKIDCLMQSSYSRKDIYSSIKIACQKHHLIKLKECDLQLIDEVLPRTLERKAVVDILLKSDKSVELYGPIGWLQWPEYKNNYKGYIDNYERIKNIYQNTLINIHNGGLSMHYRVFECMGVGGFILINNTNLDGLDYGINSYFKSGVHYGSYDLNSLSYIIEYYFNNKNERDIIRYNGMLEVQARHTWRHRAIQVINDLKLSTSFDNLNFCNRIYIDSFEI